MIPSYHDSQYRYYTATIVITWGKLTRSITPEAPAGAADVVVVASSIERFSIGLEAAIGIVAEMMIKTVAVKRILKSLVLVVQQ